MVLDQVVKSQATIEDLEGQIEDLKAKNSRLESRNAFLTTDNEALSKDKNMLQQKLKEAEKEVKHTKAAMDKVRRVNEELQLMSSSETFKLHLDNQDLMQKIHGLRDQLNYLQEQNKEWQNNNKKLLETIEAA
jgi:cell division protein FtsB